MCVEKRNRGPFQLGLMIHAYWTSIGRFQLPASLEYTSEFLFLHCNWVKWLTELLEVIVYYLFFIVDCCTSKLLCARSEHTVTQTNLQRRWSLYHLPPCKLIGTTLDVGRWHWMPKCSTMGQWRIIILFHEANSLLSSLLWQVFGYIW